MTFGPEAIEPNSSSPLGLSGAHAGQIYSQHVIPSIIGFEVNGRRSPSFPATTPVPTSAALVGPSPGVVESQGREEGRPTGGRSINGRGQSRDESGPRRPPRWRSTCSGRSTSTTSSNSSVAWSTIWASGDAAEGALVLCEHPPTISVGRSGSRAHILPDDDELRAEGSAVRWVNRGGGCVLHLPGQLAGYLALPLAASGLDLRRYLDGLHRVLIDVLDEFDLAGTTRPDAPGVFLGNARVASVGVAVSRWIAYHGFTLNVGDVPRAVRA